MGKLSGISAGNLLPYYQVKRVWQVGARPTMMLTGPHWRFAAHGLPTLIPNPPASYVSPSPPLDGLVPWRAGEKEKAPPTSAWRRHSPVGRDARAQRGSEGKPTINQRYCYCV